MAYAVADPFAQAVRSGLTTTYTVDATFGGAPVVGATGLVPLGGSITDTTKAGVRRLLSLELPATRGLFESLSRAGTRLKVTARVQYTHRASVNIPMGVFGVDTTRMSEREGTLSLTANDRWAEIQRARFVTPQPSNVGTPVVDQIAWLLRQALGQSEPITVTATSKALTPALLWEKDRDKAIIELAQSIGCWVFFDRDGTATVADIPTIGATADWLADASGSGVLIDLDRERGRGEAANVVVVESSASDGPAFPTQIVWDDDVNSPTYAGPDPINSPELAGPFGVVVYYFDTPLPLNSTSAWETGRTILARVSGLASQASWSQTINPAADAFDVFDVLPPGGSQLVVAGYRGSSGFGTTPFGSGPFGGGGSGIPVVRWVSSGAVIERHVADTVTHPLSVAGTLRVEGRSTRSEPILGGA